jgi:hypothetical protein
LKKISDKKEEAFKKAKDRNKPTVADADNSSSNNVKEKDSH